MLIKVTVSEAVLSKFSFPSQQVKRRMKLWVFLKQFDARGIPDPVK